MASQRAESIASSAVGHGLENLNLMDGVLGSDYEQDDFLQAPSLESGIFGVLFTLSQEKNQQHIYYHWILLKILLDAWQLFTTIMSPEMGWNIKPDSITWKCVSVLSFGWLKDLGYAWYVAVLYSMAGLLAVNLVLCVWVAWSFKEQKFDYVWPIKVVRGFSYVFLQVFDITSLNFLQLGISCNYVGPVTPHLHMALFPQYSCSSAPHIIHALVSGLLLLLFVAVAMLVNMSEVDVNPTSKTPQALGHSGAEVTAFGIKALMTLVGVFLGWPKVAAVAYCVLAAWLAWEYLRWVPHLLTWVNCLKGGVALAMFSVATMQLAVVLLPRQPPGSGPARTLTLVMAVSIGPVFLLGAMATFIRTRLFTAAVKKAFNNANYEAVKPQDIYHFAHPRDVEVAARCARVWTDLYTLDKAAVHRAEEIIKAGVALFPDSAYVALVYANFMLDMLGFSQTGARQLESVRKLSPSLMCRFMLFVRQQQATQKAASSNVGKGSNMDLLGYVEYQRKQRMVLRHHKDALQAMANFWRILGCSSISFSSLSKSLEEIDTSITQAETAYRVVLELYNSSPRLVRLYARFLETIKQDPWTAAQYHAAAERLEENKDEDGQGPVLPDGTPISRMDDVEKGVLVVNAFGDIQVANRKLHNMFGYKKGDLDSKNVTVLMPPHEAKRHPGLMRRYIDSGDKAAPYFRHPVLAVHRERVAFIVRIAVSRASGLGEDSVFIGLIEALPAEPGSGRVWVTSEGVIVCCDPGFVTCFGYHPDDVIGVQLDKLLRTGGSEVDHAILTDVWIASKVKHDNQEYVQKLLASAYDYSVVHTADDSGGEDNRCSVLHKYDFAKEVRISVRSDMTKSNIYEVRMKLISDEPQLLMVVERKGAIRHMSGDLAKVLGVGLAEGLSDNRQGAGNNDGGGGGGTNGDYNIAEDHVMVELMSDGLQRFLDDFLPSPWKVMHYKYRKYAKGGAPDLSRAWGCRAVMDENSNAIGPTMKLVGVHGKPVYVHVAVSSRDNQGEVTHVVRMTRSSKEQAISERRVRLRISEDAVVQEVFKPSGFDAAPSGGAGGSKTSIFSELFGFPEEQLLGCKLWDFMSLASSQFNVKPPSQTPPPLPPPQQQQVSSHQNWDFIAEAEALVRASSSGAGFGGPYGGLLIGSSGYSSGQPPPRSETGAGGVGGPYGSETGGGGGIDLRMLDTMITSSLQTPGISWRVNVVPPSASVEAAALGSAERAAAVMARRTKQAILRLDVTLPPPEFMMTPGSAGGLLVHAELWVAEAVTGVLEVDGAGRITGVLEEEVRPPGLLFGLPKEDILGSQLSTLLRFLPGQSPVGLLTDSGIAKKSALKAASKKGKIVDKVGPVHHLNGFHRDHQPLHLAVQVVGKPGPGNPVIAVIRFASPKNIPKRAFRNPAASGFGGVLGANSSMSGAYSIGPRSHAQLFFNGDEQAPVGGMPPPLPPPPPPGVGSMNSTFLPMRLREASLSRSGNEAQQFTAALATQRITGVSVGDHELKRTLTRAAQSNDGSRTFGHTIKGATEGAESSRLTMTAAAVSAINLMPPPPHTDYTSANELATSTAAVARNTLAVAPSLFPSSSTTGRVDVVPAPKPLPGSVTLAAGVASILSSRSLQQMPSMNSDAQSAAATTAVATAAVAAAAPEAPQSCATGTSSPPKPESPQTAHGGKRPVLSASPRTGADLGEVEPPSCGAILMQGTAADKRGAITSESRRQREIGALAVAEERSAAVGRGPNGLTMVTAIKALRESGSSDDQAGGVDKWVASGGQFFKNRSESLVEAELDAEEDEDEDLGSFGATSRATSSHWMSPTGSRNFNDASEDPYGVGGGGVGAISRFGQHQHHRRGLHPQQLEDGPAADNGGGAGWQAHTSHHGGLEMVEGEIMTRHPIVQESLFQGEEGGDSRGLPDVEEPMVPQPPPLDDVPDDRSDGGESAYSGISGVSGLSDGETPGDFKRGKRYRKLVKLMDSPEAQKTVVQMKIHTVLTMLATGMVHIVCFSLVITAVKKQSHALNSMSAAGQSQVHLQKILLETRALDQAYQGKGTDTTYSQADAQVLASNIMEDCQEFRRISNLLLSDNAGDTEELYYGKEIRIWSGINATTNLPYYEKITLWDMITRIFVSAKLIFQSHLDWKHEGINISSSLPGAFLLNCGQALVPGTTEVLNALLDTAVRRTNAVKMLQLTFLILEGFVVTLLSAIIMVSILRLVCDQRYQLYESFLKIPVGLTRALASQTTHLLDDDESDDEEEGDGSQVDNDDNSPSAPKRKTLFDDGNGSSSANTQDQGGGRGGSGGGGRGGSGGISAAGFAPRGSVRQRRSSAAMYGTSKGGSRPNDESSRGLLTNAAANRAHRNGGGASPMYHPPLATTATFGNYSNRFSLSNSVNDRNHHHDRPQGWLGRLFGKIWRSNAVSPLASPESSPTPHESSSSSSRRTLERNSRIPQATLIFIVVYSLLIILFYSISYSTLLGVKDMVALHGVAEQNAERTYRTVFYAQELLSEGNHTRVPERIMDLRSSASALRDAYFTLRMGANAWTAVGHEVERFPLVRGHGLVKETGSIFQLFYADNHCLRFDEHLPCPAIPFYQIIVSGVDGMMTQLLLEVKHLADRAEATVLSNSTPPGLSSSPEWEYIYNVGTVDLYDGNQKVVAQHIADIRKVFNAVVVLHVLLFMLLMGVWLSFLIVLYLPLLRRMTKEKRRIAEMMSQLPTELDVMRLVSAALMGPKLLQPHPAAHHRQHGRSTSRRIQARSPATGMASGGTPAASAGISGPLVISGDASTAPAAIGGGAVGGDGVTTSAGSKGYQSWKDILNRTNVSSVTNKDSATALSAKRSFVRP